MERKMIKVGSKVVYRADFGLAEPQEVRVKSIDKYCENSSEIALEKVSEIALEKVNEIAFDDKDYCIFDLANGHWCYGTQIDDLAKDTDIAVRVTFRSEVFLYGKTIEEIKQQWEEMPIFCVDALDDNDASVVEVISCERVDDNSYDNVDLD